MNVPTVSDAARKVRQRRTRMIRTCQSGLCWRGRFLQQEIQAFTRCWGVKAAALRRVVPSISDHELAALLPAVDLYSPTDEIVFYRRVGKANGGFRTICEFGPKHRARQQILKWLADDFCGVASEFFDRKGRGTAHAVSAIANALKDTGPFILSADIKDCFQSIDVNAVYDLGLFPPEVVRFAIDPRFLNIQPIGGAPNHTTAIRDYDHSVISNHLRLGRPKGLLQGSKVSNSLLVLLLRQLPNVFAPYRRPFVYVDNIYAVFENREHALQASENLVGHLADHPAGVLTLRSELIDAREGVDVLGYHILLNGGRSIVSLNDRNLGRYCDNIDRAVMAKPLGRGDLVLLAQDVIARFPAISDEHKTLMMDHAIQALAEGRSVNEDFRVVG